MAAQPIPLPAQLIEVAADAPKIDVMMLTYRVAVTPPIMAITEMVQWARKDGIDARLHMFGGALVNVVRDGALADARPGASVLFVDDDMTPPHPHAIKSLVDLNVECVAPLFTNRSEPVSLTVKKWDEATDTLKSIESLKEATDNTILMGPFCVGMAFTLIQADAIEKVREYHLSARDWLDDNRLLLDRLHVRAELREKERQRREQARRDLFQRERLARLFDFTEMPDGTRLGEDIAFCRKMLKSGVKMALDCRLEMAPGHVGTYAFGIWDMATPNNRKEFYDVLRGARE